MISNASPIVRRYSITQTLPNNLFLPVEGNSYVVKGIVSIGLYKLPSDRVVLFDSGLDNQIVKKISKALAKESLNVRAIINTHGHADHCGGNFFFQKEDSTISTFASTLEKFYIENPSQEPICFCGGAAPFKELQNKFLQATPSKITDEISLYEDQDIDIDECRFQIITLPGHTPGMIGIITPDNVFYCGDAIFGASTFDKHGVLFYTNIVDTLKTFQKLKALKVEYTVLYHGGILEQSLESVAEEHELRILSTAETVLDFIMKKPQTIDSLTKDIYLKYDIKSSVMQITLTRTCVMAYVTYLQSQDRVIIDAMDGEIIIKPKIEIEDEKIPNK